MEAEALVVAGVHVALAAAGVAVATSAGLVRTRWKGMHSLVIGREKAQQKLVKFFCDISIWI